MASTYVLIDTLLIGDSTAKPWLKKRHRPRWLARIYERPAAEVSPILIDIEAAQKAGRIGDVMEIANSTYPQLGVSFIDTELELNELADHLRQFIFACTEDGTQLSLRFADCAVLPPLATVCSPAQWTAMTGPMVGWTVHDHAGSVRKLPLGRCNDAATVPLVFLQEQIAALREALGTYELLRNLRVMRPAEAEQFRSSQAYDLAFQSRSLWQAAGHSDGTQLVLFAREVFATDGRILLVPTLPGVLAQTNMAKVRDGIKRIVSYQY